MNYTSKKDFFLKILLITLFSVGLFWLSYFTQRTNFYQLFAIYSALFVVYFFLIKTFSSTRQIILTGIFFRMLLLFAIPNLSDDFYRFVWDGRLLIKGFNPFTILPIDFVQSSDFQGVIFDKSLFQNLNSPNYYSVYPPINQLIFGISAWFSNGSLFRNIVWLRVFILIAEVFSLWLLIALKPYRFQMPSSRKPIRFEVQSSRKPIRFEVQSSRKSLRFEPMALYAFNPLIIIELTGNLHFEALVICFLLLAYWLFLKNALSWSAFFFSIAVAIKLLPLIFIPLIIRHLGLKKGIVYSTLIGFLTMLFFLPFIDKALIIKVFSSINLYYQKFEFNASIYYIFREIGYFIFGYNIIASYGKWMFLLSFIGILWISYKSKGFFKSALLILSLYLAFATTVHPWYASTLILISVFTTFRYPILWSFLVFLSYFTYKTASYQENLWLIAVEYLFVYSFALYEFFEEKRNKQHVIK